MSVGAAGADRTRAFLVDKLASDLSSTATTWLHSAAVEIERGATSERFCGLLSLASRHVPRRGASAWSERELGRANELVPGWNPERWSALETARVSLVLARADLALASAVRALEDAFRYADIGELCALYKSLALWPGPERLVWCAGEGCRTSIRVVYEAAACDTPFPLQHFDANAWRQMVIKALFMEAPLWRIVGLDTRLDAELARMALDLAEERRSAGRPVRPELWLCLGKHGGTRGLESLERELAGKDQLGRRAAALALARAGESARLERWLTKEQDPLVAETMRAALAGHADPKAWRALAG